MTAITFKGNTIHTLGALPKAGDMAPDFKATDGDLNDITLQHFLGKKVILNIFPSLDTGVCANAMRRFNDLAKQFPKMQILSISADLPFAQQRFCKQEDIKNILPLSIFRHPDFGKKYGVLLTDGPLAGLLARSVVAINEKGNVIYTELVKEITDEPNYSGLISALQKTEILT